MNTPAPTPPLQVFRVETFVDNQQRLIIAKSELHPGDMFTLGKQTFIGQGVAAVPTGDGGVQQVPFEIPLDGPTIHDAYAQFDAAQQPAWDAHVQKVRALQLKQRVSLNQLMPTDGAQFKK